MYLCSLSLELTFKLTSITSLSYFIGWSHPVQQLKNWTNTFFSYEGRNHEHTYVISVDIKNALWAWVKTGRKMFLCYWVSVYENSSSSVDRNVLWPVQILSNINLSFYASIFADSQVEIPFTRSHIMLFSYLFIIDWEESYFLHLYIQFLLPKLKNFCRIEHYYFLCCYFKFIKAWKAWQFPSECEAGVIITVYYLWYASLCVCLYMLCYGCYILHVTYTRFLP